MTGSARHSLILHSHVLALCLKFNSLNSELIADKVDLQNFSDRNLILEFIKYIKYRSKQRIIKDVGMTVKG